jgi:hypothetical protein
MKAATRLALVALCFTLSGCVGLNVGPTAKLNGPTGDFGDRHGSGYTVGAQGEFMLGMFSITGDAGWTRFSGADFEGTSYDAADGFELAAGGRLLLGPAFAGAQYGYGTGDLEQSLFRPEVGVHFGPLSVFAQYQVVKKKWWSLGGTFSLF